MTIIRRKIYAYADRAIVTSTVTLLPLIATLAAHIDRDGAGNSLRRAESLLPAVSSIYVQALGMERDFPGHPCLQDWRIFIPIGELFLHLAKPTFCLWNGVRDAVSFS